jgi:anti-sigma B factor antagonist
LKVDVKEIKPGMVVISPLGDVDMSTSPELRSAMAPPFKQGASHIVVDLSGVPYIDSSGIATLIEGLQLSRKGSIRFTIVGANPSVEAVFELAYLKDVFEMFPQLDQLLEGEMST